MAPLVWGFIFIATQLYNMGTFIYVITEIELLCKFLHAGIIILIK
jgi:hypothetical protein